jgi:ribose 5-phosphate isomerase A
MTPVLRTDGTGAAVVSDSGGWTLDCTPAAALDGSAARELEARLQAIPGVVDTGLFLGVADAVLVGHPDGRADLRRRGRAR